MLCTGTRGNYVQLDVQSLGRTNPASAHASQHAKPQHLLVYLFIYLLASERCHSSAAELHLDLNLCL